MNYAKLIGSALTLFPKKIRVQLTDAISGKPLGAHKIPSEQLPPAFNKPTLLAIDNTSWQVVSADPVLSDDFMFTKKLSLQVVQPAEKSRFMLDHLEPTRSAERPGLSPHFLFHDLTLDMPAADWRQLEFLPVGCREMIVAEQQAVEEIVSGQEKPLLGYRRQFSREATATVVLQITWESFCAILRNPVMGRIALGKEGFVTDGFAIQSDSFLWYGLLQEGTITRLGLVAFDGVDDELMQVLEMYKLILVDWVNGSTLSAEAGEEPKSEFVNI